MMFRKFALIDTEESLKAFVVVIVVAAFWPPSDKDFVTGRLPNFLN